MQRKMLKIVQSSKHARPDDRNFVVAQNKCDTLAQVTEDSNRNSGDFIVVQIHSLGLIRNVTWYLCEAPVNSDEPIFWGVLISAAFLPGTCCIWARQEGWHQYHWKRKPNTTIQFLTVKHVSFWTVFVVLRSVNLPTKKCWVIIIIPIFLSPFWQLHNHWFRFTTTQKNKWLLGLSAGELKSPKLSYCVARSKLCVCLYSRYARRCTTALTPSLVPGTEENARCYRFQKSSTVDCG